MDLLICATCESVTEKYGLRKIYESNDFHQLFKNSGIFSRQPIAQAESIGIIHIPENHERERLIREENPNGPAGQGEEK